ncbi:MAG: exonuclease SbcCD subunit D C-terminal domain-containing protein, partial [Proteobacteria bacterium]|nr:exonuclease SbcCD subunit D C-terminal domain-containing protein [Pseudomonadota bacterium]
IGMGHLFTAGGRTMDGDGVRELYIGSLAHVSKEIFPKGLDYLALGHLHVPQRVGNCDHIRYAGSPIPMGYGEAKQPKSVVIVDFKSHPLEIKLHGVPGFQALERITGTMDEILQRIDALKSDNSRAWLEVEFTGDTDAGNLRQMIEAAVADSGMEIRRIKNRRVIDRVIRQACDQETLDDLDVIDVFNRLLDSAQVADMERPNLLQTYQEIITCLHEEDTNAQ